MIRALNLLVTDSCNSKCASCNIWKDKPDSLMDIEKLKNFLRGNICKGVREVSISGGEPTLHPKIIDMCKSISEIESIKDVFFTTNGINVSKVIRCLEIFVNNNKNTHLVVSLDSVGDRHDIIRGVKCFNKVERLIREAREIPAFIEIIVSATLSKHSSINDFKLVEKYISENNLVFTFRVAEESSYYNNEKSDIGNITRELKYYVLQYLENNLVNHYNIALYDYLLYDNNILVNEKGNLICDAGKSFITIDSNNAIKKCIHSKLIMGNLSNKNLFNNNEIITNCPCFTECSVWPTINYGSS